jgi:hypothetical protein
VLLACADGELGCLTRWRVARHLKRCWRCRARSLELDQMVRALVAADAAPAPSAEWLETAWTRFTTWEENFERRRSVPQLQPAERRAWTPRLAPVVASLSVAVAAFVTWQQTREPVRPPERPAAPAPLKPHAPAPPTPAAHFRPITPAVVPPPPVPPPPTAPAPLDVDSWEIEALDALHGARACLGEPVEVLRPEPGRLLIRGRVASADRRDEVLTALADRRFPAQVTVDIRSIEELSEPVGDPVGPSSAAEVERVSKRFPIEEALSSFLAATGSGMGPADFANRALEASDAALAEAWALRRLQERYPAATVARLDARSRALLARMQLEHLRTLSHDAQGAQRLLEPLLRSVAGAQASAAAAPPQSSTVMGAFELAARGQKLVSALFAGTAPLDDVAAKARELLSLYPATQSQARRLAGSIEGMESQRVQALDPHDRSR